jgi:hypothetical protein
MYTKFCLSSSKSHLYIPEHKSKKKTTKLVSDSLSLCKCGVGLQTGDAVSGAFQNLKDAVTPNK